MISEERLRDLVDECLDQPWGFARAVEREAYEAAAKVCDALDGTMGGPKCGCNECCAAAIRALAGEKS